VAGATQAQESRAEFQAQQQEREHRLVIQVSDNDPARMILALNKAVNVSQHYARRGQEVRVEAVAYGPRLHMLRADTSPVNDRIESFSKSMPNVSLAACGNTLEIMKKAEGKDLAILPRIEVIEAGVTRILELQEQGWS
jgi:intracellular sulfur oxidation DsrE/DsrF family protein